MTAFALFLFLLGFVLARRMKVFVLVPATLLAWGAAVNFARIFSLSVLATILAAFLAGVCLQAGYFAGGMLVHRRLAQAKKHVLLLLRR